VDDDGGVGEGDLVAAAALVRQNLVEHHGVLGHPVNFLPPLHLDAGNAGVDVPRLGYHGKTATRLVTEAGGTWSRYAPGDHTR
jgi:hypothetical protein